MTNRMFWFFLSSLCCFMNQGCKQASSDDPTPESPCQEVQFEEVLIPMTDGAELAGVVRRPVDARCVLPTIFMHTPYNKDLSRDQWLSDDGTNPLYDGRDYAVVFSDWRGRHGSKDADGDGQTDTATRATHGEDGADVVEWIASQPWSDGHVGMFGVSGPGNVQFGTAMNQPEHLDAIVPVFADAGETFGKWLPGGVPRKEYLDALGILYGASADFLVNHPTYDNAWVYVEGLTDPGLIEVPVLHINGFFDLCNTCTLVAQPQLTGSPEIRVLIGDWHHFAVGGETDWGDEPMSEQELLWWDAERRIQLKTLAFFDRHLRGVESEADNWAPVVYERAGEWLEADTWPPADTTERTFYLGAGTLQDTPPAEEQVDFPYDPQDPSPTIGGQTLHFEYARGPGWQDDVVARDDVVVFMTEPLAEPLSLAGEISGTLRVATTGDDTHIVIRLTDVYPDGRHLLLTDGVRRMSLHQSLSVHDPVPPGDFVDVEIEATNHLGWRFEAGHRVGLVVTSSSHSRFERANNRGTLFYEDAAEPLTVTNTIALGESTLTLRVQSP